MSLITITFVCVRIDDFLNGQFKLIVIIVNICLKFRQLLLHSILETVQIHIGSVSVFIEHVL